MKTLKMVHIKRYLEKKGGGGTLSRADGKFIKYVMIFVKS